MHRSMTYLGYVCPCSISNSLHQQFCVSSVKLLTVYSCIW